MTNPFCVAGRTIHDPGPLCPWLENDHADYYVAVDRTQEACDEFKRRLSEFNVARNGSTVLVHGEDGCGKTSLIHRCADLLIDWQLETHKSRSEVIDRSSENLAGVVILRRCEDTVDAILQLLRQNVSFLAADAMSAVPALPTEPDQLTLRKTVEALSRKLVESKLSLIVIAPKVELSDELRTYLSIFQRGGISLFLEAADHDVVASATRWNREGQKSITVLEVGSLSPDDGWKFVAARFQKRQEAKDSPVFSEAGVNEYMKKRSSRAKISLRELERVCIALYEEARAAASPQIDYQQFADHYLKVASLATQYGS